MKCAMRDLKGDYRGLKDSYVGAGEILQVRLHEGALFPCHLSVKKPKFQVGPVGEDAHLVPLLITALN